ncbi:hypothetical protein B7463_g11458, partial [Scytalidium lignicola]
MGTEKELTDDKGHISHSNDSISAGDVEVVNSDEVANAVEIFKRGEDVVDFRTVSWPKASAIFLKVIFATGVLSIPTAMFDLGAVGGSLSVIGWGLVNTYSAIVLGNFRNSHPGCHSVADMAQLVGGVFFREFTGAMFIIACILCAGSGILGISIALNVFSKHGICTVWFTLVATILAVALASFRKLHQIGILTYIGFASIYVAVFIVVIGVTTRDRPAIAPRTGDFELGYHVIASPDFITGVGASLTIFASSAGTPVFLPVISEMKNPKDYNKAVYCCMVLVQMTYLAFSLVVYRWCGQWVANPSLGSAGRIIEIAAYAIGFFGLVVSACLYMHVAAKYIFVRILRNSKHLQDNSIVHWGTWLGCTASIGAIGFILCEAIPIFSFIIAMIGSFCFAPLTIMLPALFWLYDFGHYRKEGLLRKLQWLFHISLILLGAFMCVAGNYSVIKQIIAAYADGTIGGAFSCTDNSGVTAGDS